MPVAVVAPPITGPSGPAFAGATGPDAVRHVLQQLAQADVPPTLEQAARWVVEQLFEPATCAHTALLDERLAPGEDPAHGQLELDQSLRAILRRALTVPEPERYPGLLPFVTALQDWLEQRMALDLLETGPAPLNRPADATPRVVNPVLQSLLTRMRRQSDFPAMSSQIVKIQRMASSENENLNHLTNEILEDVALTNKLLRLVNSARFAHLGGDISTVSRAVSLIGFSEVRNIAMSLVLLEHMHDKAHASQIKTGFLRAMFAGTYASELCNTPAEQEEAFIGAMFQSLGRLLCEFYFPQEADRIRQLLAEGKATTQEQASKRVLGLSFEELALGVADVWRLPRSMQRLMRRKEGPPPNRPLTDPQERLRWVATAGNEMADTLLQAQPEHALRQLERLANRYASSMDKAPQALVQMGLTASAKMAAAVLAMELDVEPDSPAQALLQAGQPVSTPSQCAQPADADTPAPLPTAPVDMHMRAAAAPPQAPPSAVDLLATGVQDVTQAMVDGGSVNDVLRMIAETMFRAMAFQRVLLCLKDASADRLVGRLCLGRDALRVQQLFRIDMKAADNLFSAVALKGVDTLIRDATSANVAARLPDWYRRNVGAPSFLLLPLQGPGGTFGLIYADRAEAGGSELQERELALLKSLRNQAVMAVRQLR
jgi:eukaryotic-like serine/threonine-protein kinase